MIEYKEEENYDFHKIEKDSEFQTEKIITVSIHSFDELKSALFTLIQSITSPGESSLAVTPQMYEKIAEVIRLNLQFPAELFHIPNIEHLFFYDLVNQQTQEAQLSNSTYAIFDIISRLSIMNSDYQQLFSRHPIILSAISLALSESANELIDSNLIPLTVRAALRLAYHLSPENPDDFATLITQQNIPYLCSFHTRLLTCFLNRILEYLPHSFEVY